MKVIEIPDDIELENPNGTDKKMTMIEFIRGLLKMNPDFGKQPEMYIGFKIQDVLEEVEGSDSKELYLEDKQYEMLKKALELGINPDMAQQARTLVEAFDAAKTPKKPAGSSTPDKKDKPGKPDDT